MTIHQEIKKTLKEKGKHIITETIAPQLEVNIKEYTNDILSGMTTLERSNERQVNRTYNRIYTDLIGQTIRYLFKLQGETKNKCPLNQ